MTIGKDTILTTKVHNPFITVKAMTSEGLNPVFTPFAGENINLQYNIPNYGIEKTNENLLRPDIDTNAIIKAYKSGTDINTILNELNCFNDEEIQILGSFVNNLNDMESLLSLIDTENLTVDDMTSAMKKVKEKHEDGFMGWLKRTRNVISKAFNDGFDEAYKLAKSEQVYMTKEFSEDMDKIRGIRQEFSSDGLVEIANAMYENPEIENETMHFVTRDRIAGQKLYDENSILSAVHTMSENTNSIDEYFKNVLEFESIKDEKGNIKYAGSTIVDVNNKMIKNKELAPTIKIAAHKGDMKDNYLINITNNLIETPEMQNSIQKFLTMKDKNGKDRFSSANVSAQSTYMRGKSTEQINTYTENTIELASYSKMSGDNIVNTAATITDYPESRNQIMSRVQDDNYSGNQVEQYSVKYSKSKTGLNSNSQQNDTQISSEQLRSEYSDKTSYQIQNKTSEKTNKNNNVSETNTLETKKYTSIIASITGQEVSKDETFTKKDAEKYLYQKYGSAGDIILRKLEADSRFINFIEKYGDNPEILLAVISNPDCIDKLTCISSSITTDQLGQFAKLCTSTEKIETIARLIQTFGPQKALALAEKSEVANNQKDILNVLKHNTVKIEDKKEAVEKLITNNKIQGNCA